MGYEHYPGHYQDTLLVVKGLRSKVVTGEEDYPTKRFSAYWSVRRIQSMSEFNQAVTVHYFVHVANSKELDFSKNKWSLGILHRVPRVPSGSPAARR